MNVEQVFKAFRASMDDLPAAILALAEVPNKASAPEPEWLEIKAASRKLGIGTKKMYQLCADGLIQHQRIGRQIRISPNDLRIATNPKKKTFAELERHFD